ncbi:RNA-dependent RNA polymerase 1-like [Carica papaya]|uniref:RNA-dependent RNA polymerase 1-like n=1 Tax=Carica papaya TaxID=3649 RepID=UPI000B8CED4E|nr:RNA-dependent RNA polymerase 1-like [Carica papaya]
MLLRWIGSLPLNLSQTAVKNHYRMGETINLYGFASVVSPESLKTFLERHTGKGTIYALEVVPPKNEMLRARAKVQFISAESACYIDFLANKRSLWFENSCLKTSFMDYNIAPEPRIFRHSIDNVTVNFGCQISEERFSVLWKKANVLVRFGLRKMYFFLSYLSTDFKLVLSFDNIWKIELHRPRGQTKNFFIIQLLGAPRIYEKDVPALSYFKEATDDQWVRQVDFTPSCCIGQSSAICLELRCWRQLSDFQKAFGYYKERIGKWILETGSSFSCNQNLVSVVSPPQGVNLPYEILFKVNSLVQHGCLPGPALSSGFFNLVDPQRVNIAYIEHALEKLYNLKECCYEPLRWLSKQYQEYQRSSRLTIFPSVALDEGLVYIRRVQVTPCKVYFCGPELNLSNRVLRNYPDDINNFLRVSFVDEELGKMYSADLCPRLSSADKEILPVDEERRTRIYQRILSILRNGIIIGDKKFKFLAFSSSQVRENSVWMFASRPGLTAADIRERIGDFRQIRNVAKYAARLGQSFSSSRETLHVSREEIEVISDVEATRDGIKYVFSDGIGKISQQLAEVVAKKCGCNGYTPSAFQIRYGGYKGVVAIDPESSVKLSFRKSMDKFKSDSTNLDVLAWSKYQPYFLNRQLITLMSSLGVKDDCFRKKQKEALAQLDAMLTDSLRAQDALELMSPGENMHFLREMLNCGYKPDSEPFLSMMLRSFCAAKLHDLRTKTRIFIRDGRSMMGCLDETGKLEYGQVFVQYSGANRWEVSADSLQISSGNGLHVVQGNVVIAKNPCLHPGDMRVLRAVDVPALHHMVDCVVFPQKGKRPHPNECSGSDLDDWLLYSQQVEEFFANYVVNDSLGIISSAHTVHADREPMMAKSESCIKLAELSSIAVDFPKTGVPAKIPPNLRIKQYPDFMEKCDKPTYKSKRVIGKLYREVKRIASQENPIRSFTKEMAKKYYDPDMEVDGFEDYVNDALCYRRDYNDKLASLMHYYGIKSEAEIISGCIIEMSKSFHRRDVEQIVLAVNALRKEARSWFNEKRSDLDSGADNIFAKASAWYHVTYHPKYYNARGHFLSFAWCVYDQLLQIKRDKVSIRRSSPMSSPESHVLHELNVN